MNLRSLEYFIEVAKQNSFSKAAKNLFVTQPTLSRHVADLEKELKAQLFIRESKKVVLTDAGKICFKEAQKIVGLVNNMVNKVNDLESKKKLQLNIGYLTSIQSAINNPIIEFCNKYSDININMIGCHSNKMLPLFKYGEIDIMITVKEALRVIHNIEIIKILKNELLIMVSENHPLAMKKAIKISELKNEGFIVLDQHISPTAVNYFLGENNKLGFNLHVSNHVKDMFTLILLVSSGKGISFISSEALPILNEAKGIKLLPVEDIDIDIDIVLAYDIYNKNPSIKIFIEEMKKKFLD